MLISRFPPNTAVLGLPLQVLIRAPVANPANPISCGTLLFPDAFTANGTGCSSNLLDLNFKGDPIDLQFGLNVRTLKTAMSFETPLGFLELGPNILCSSTFICSLFASSNSHICCFRFIQLQKAQISLHSRGRHEAVHQQTGRRTHYFFQTRRAGNGIYCRTYWASGFKLFLGPNSATVAALRHGCAPLIDTFSERGGNAKHGHIYWISGWCFYRCCGGCWNSILDKLRLFVF
jgi:hypothetical protein